MKEGDGAQEENSLLHLGKINPASTYCKGERGPDPPEQGEELCAHTGLALWSVKGVDRGIISSLDLIPTQTMCVILGNLSFLSIYPLIH